MALRSAALSLVLVLVVPLCAAADATISFFVFLGADQGVVPREVIARYEQEHPGVTVDVVESSNAIVVPMMVAARHATPDDPPIDCGFFNVEAISRGDLEDLWEPLGPDLVPRVETVLARYRRPLDRGVPYQMTTIGIVYRKTAEPAPAATWSVLWDPSSRGRVAVLDYPLFLVALAGRLRGKGENDADAGFAVLSESAGNIRALVESADGLKNALVGGDATYAPWFHSVATVWIAGGAPLGFVVPREGAVAYPYYLATVRGVSPEERAACAGIIDALLAPNVARRHAELTHSVPLIEGLPAPRVGRDPLLDLTAAESAILLDYAAIAKASGEWRRRWDREVRRRLE